MTLVNKVTLNMKYENVLEEKTIIFLHIPKTGGMSLTRIALENYDSSSVFIIDGLRVNESLNELKELSLEQKTKIKFIAGHNYFETHQFIPNKSTYITILREPIERVISSYYYMLTTPDNPFHKDVVQYKFFEDYLGSKEGKRFKLHDNFQVRLLSGIRGVGYGECSQEMLEAAKFNLNNSFSLVGLTENFDDFLASCQKKLGWKHIPARKENVNSSRPSKNEISEKALRKIAADNIFDIELYGYVKEQVEKSLLQGNV